MIRLYAFYGFCCIACTGLSAQTIPGDTLTYVFNGGYGQVEVGGRFAGAEFHRSRPLPSRISFYSPVANSIDVSTDYWKRDESLPMAIAVQINKGQKHWLGKESWMYSLSPHRVTFESKEPGLRYSVSYEFCLTEPAMVFSLKIKNISAKPTAVSAYTHLKLALRTCQTYARKDSAWTDYDKSTNAVLARFDDTATQQAACFVENVGVIPSEWTTSSSELAVSDSGSSGWLTSTAKLKEKTFSSGSKGIPVAAFVYERALQPGESLDITQVIGSSRKDEISTMVTRLAASWRSEITAYDNFVRGKVQKGPSFATGDAWLDRSAAWACAILATNAHYIDGSIVPMPCPAEYNFFFTHDVLMTNLAAVNFDLPRVKKDLMYIASHAKDGIIPHAYYWRDDGFKTEYCTPDNWNHLWFILVSASYLRHSADDSTANMLYPLVTKSLEEILTQKKGECLMYAYRPDWWDIGHIEGPRSYITILTIRALRDYLYFSASLKKNRNRCIQYERCADSMQASLQKNLWDPETRYLMNWNAGQKDPHYYMGSLLAPAFGILGEEKAKALVATATKELLDPRIGVRAAMPADFSTKESISYFKFAGDEAGQPYFYINGGVWPHNNAWYALALKNVGRVDDAVRFVKTTMTLDGVAGSPMGIPAMYEYRFSDPGSTEFGRIDKPSFLWAGGFYLYTLYQLFGVKENEWNVSWAGPLPSSFKAASYSLAMGKTKDVTISGKGRYLQSCTIDGKTIPSLVIPNNIQNVLKLGVEFGKPRMPYLESVNAMLASARFDTRAKRLMLGLLSYAGHQTTVTVVSPSRPKEAWLDGKKPSDVLTSPLPGGVYQVKITYPGSDAVQALEIGF